MWGPPMLRDHCELRGGTAVRDHRPLTSRVDQPGRRSASVSMDSVACYARVGRPPRCALIVCNA
jgi:hypothetical protein